jgi:hypothetical protein
VQRPGVGTGSGSKAEHLAGIKKDIAALAPGQFFDLGPVTDEPLRGPLLHSIFPPIIAKTRTGTGDSRSGRGDVDPGVDEAVCATSLLCHSSSQRHFAASHWTSKKVAVPVSLIGGVVVRLAGHLENFG